MYTFDTYINTTKDLSIVPNKKSPALGAGLV